MIELLNLSQVLEAVRSTGTEVRYHDEECKEGYAGMYKLRSDTLIICPNNQLNHSDLFDTIRHEAIHIAQACNGKPILSYDYYLKNAPDHIKDAVSEYPQDRFTQHMELEAFMGAAYLNEGQVINMINKYCFE